MAASTIVLGVLSFLAAGAEAGAAAADEADAEKARKKQMAERSRRFGIKKQQKQRSSNMDAKRMLRTQRDIARSARPAPTSEAGLVRGKAPELSGRSDIVAQGLGLSGKGSTIPVEEIVSGAGQIIGTGIEAAGASKLAKADLKEEKEMLAMSKREFEADREQTDREQGLEAQDYLFEDRLKAQSGKKRYNTRFLKDFAMGAK